MVPGLPLVVDAMHRAEIVIRGRTLVNFASAHYLGLVHERRSQCACATSGARDNGEELGTRLALGVPRTLAVDRAFVDLERELARWTRNEQAFAGTSTLHVLLELLNRTATERGLVALYGPVYATTRLAADLARARGARVLHLQDRAPEVVRRALRSRLRRPAVLVCDSWSFPGFMAPLDELHEICEETRTTLIIDDTPAIGILGEVDAASGVYGSGGGGSALHRGLRGSHVVVVASLAKAFGVPLAFAAGAAHQIGQLRRGELAYATSPPDLASVLAAQNALTANANYGDSLRERLLNAVDELRVTLKTTGTRHFPVQSWRFRDQLKARRMWQKLWGAGIWAILRESSSIESHIVFVLTAQHDEAVLARAFAAIQSAVDKAAA
jgi:8-amino-7-oxononanoate synthase